MGANWLNTDDCIKGFEWRNGPNVVTHGIHIWSKPFLFESQSNGKVWVGFFLSLKINFIMLDI